MKWVGSVFAVLVGLGLLVLLGFGLYWGFQLMADLYRSLDTQVAAAIVFVIVAIFIGSLLVAWSRDWRIRAGRREQLRMQRVEIYSLLLDVWSMYLEGQWGILASGEIPSSTEVQGQVEADLKTVEHQLALWSSSKVLRAYANCKEYASTHASSDPELATRVGQLVSEMRKDIGTHDLGIGDSDVLPRFFGKASDGSGSSSAHPSGREQNKSAPSTAGSDRAIT